MGAVLPVSGRTSKLGREIVELRKRIAELESENHVLRIDLRQARVEKFAAQRGLVEYLRASGQSKKIGYDPTMDADLVRELSTPLPAYRPSAS